MKKVDYLLKLANYFEKKIATFNKKAEGELIKNEKILTELKKMEGALTFYGQWLNKDSPKVIPYLTNMFHYVQGAIISNDVNHTLNVVNGYISELIASSEAVMEKSDTKKAIYNIYITALANIRGTLQPDNSSKRSGEKYGVIDKDLQVKLSEVTGMTVNPDGWFGKQSFAAYSKMMNDAEISSPRCNSVQEYATEETIRALVENNINAIWNKWSKSSLEKAPKSIPIGNPNSITLQI